MVGGNRGRKFVVTLSRRGFSRVFEPRTSLIRYLKIPTYFDPFVAECAVDLERIRGRFIIFIIPEEEYYLSVGMVVLFNIFDTLLRYLSKRSIVVQPFSYYLLISRKIIET